MLAQPGVKPTRKLQHESRAPGICGALLGFLFLFMGIMMLAIKDVTKEDATRSIVVAGPICLTLGLIFIALGFAHQFWRHRKWKEKEYTRTRARNAKSEKYVTENGSAAGPTIDGIVLGVNGLDYDMKLDMNGFAISEQSQSEFFQSDEPQESYDDTTPNGVICMAERDPSSDTSSSPQAGPSRYTTEDEIVTVPSASYDFDYLRASEHFYGVDEDDDDDDDDNDESYRGYEDTDYTYTDSPYSLEFAQDYSSTQEEPSSLSYEPAKTFTDPGIFCVSSPRLQAPPAHVPSQEDLQSETSGKTPRYSRYSSKARLKQLLPSIKLPKILTSPRGGKTKSPRVPSPTGSTGSRESSCIVVSRPSSPNVMPTDGVAGYTRRRSKSSSLKIPHTLTSKARSLRAGLKGGEVPRRRDSLTQSADEQDTGQPGSRPGSATSSSSSRPGSALRKPHESVVRAEVHVSFSMPDQRCPSPRPSSPETDGTGSCSELRSPRSLSTTSLQDSRVEGHMPDASS